MKPILLALDFSEYSDALLKYAIEFCELMPAQQPHLHLLHVMPSDIGMVIADASMQYIPEIEENERQEEYQKLLAFQAQIPQNIPSDIILQQGDVEDVILDLEASLQPQFIIMGSHGSGKLHDFFFGNITKNIIQKSHVPVLVVPCHG
jgi:nucleotide-binding universal stress UspA family protein